MTEKMYNDFVTNVLPKIEEGLMITKDYFQDLFGRYIQYLIIRDAASVVGFTVAFIVALIVLYIYWNRVLRNEENRGFLSDFPEKLFVAFLIALTAVGLLAGAITYADNLIKDIYVPEIRVYEELSDHLK